MDDYKIGMVPEAKEYRQDAEYEEYQQDPRINDDFQPRNYRVEVDTSKFDPMLQDKLQVLNSQKLTAIENQDFDEAKAIKMQTDRVKIIGTNIVKLEEK